VDYPETIGRARHETSQPHQLAFYLKELPAAFHSYYNSTRVLSMTRASDWRASRWPTQWKVLANGLAILG